MNQNMPMYPNYPVYPMPNPMMPMNPDYSNQGQNYNIGKMQEEINDLKKRVTALERTINHNNYNGTKFNDTSYHIM